jgi:hypothetical protein
MTKLKRYKRYSSEFKREAIRRASEEGVTDAAVCAELGISARQFRRWRDELQLLGNDAFPGQVINFHRGIWYGSLSPLFEPGLFAVIDRIGNTPNLEDYWFTTQYVVQS